MDINSIITPAQQLAQILGYCEKDNCIGCPYQGDNGCRTLLVDTKQILLEQEKEITSLHKVISTLQDSLTTANKDYKEHEIKLKNCQDYIDSLKVELSDARRLIEHARKTVINLMRVSNSHTTCVACDHWKNYQCQYRVEHPGQHTICAPMWNEAYHGV